MAARAPLIAICGTSQATPVEHDLAFAVGRQVAQRGGVVVCGGLTGVMAAAAEGAQSVGGTSIGLLPGRDPDDAADAVTLAIPTGLGEMRNGLIAASSRAMIAIGGGYGTLSEIGFMLRIGRPVAALATWPVIPPGGDHLDPVVHWTESSDEAVAWIFEQLARPSTV